MAMYNYMEIYKGICEDILARGNSDFTVNEMYAHLMARLNVIRPETCKLHMQNMERLGLIRNKSFILWEVMKKKKEEEKK